MKVSRSVRLSEDLSEGVAWYQRRQGGDASVAIRRLVRKGLEREIAEIYGRGQVTIREASAVLSLPVRECLELMWQLGVTGNVSTSQAVEAWELVDSLAGL